VLDAEATPPLDASATLTLLPLLLTTCDSGALAEAVLLASPP